MLDRLLAATFGPAPADAYEAEIQRAIQRVVEHLMALAGGAPMSQVRALATSALRTRASALEAAGSPPASAHAALLAADITRFLERPAPPVTGTPLPSAPPGAPIGEPAMDWLRRLEPACSGEPFDR